MNVATRLLAGTALLLLAACGGGGASFTITALGLAGQEPGAVSGGLTAGGETLVVAGRGFEDACEVYFGAVPSPGVTFISSTEVRAVTPAMPEGAVDLVVRNPDGSETRRTGAFVFGVRPGVFSLAALGGPTAGLPEVPVDTTTDVQCAGMDFRAGVVVLVGGAAVPTVFVDANTLRFTAPERAIEGGADVTVRNPGRLDTTLAGGLFFTQDLSLAPMPGAPDAAQLRHLHRRAGLGVEPGTVAANLGRSRQQAVDALLDVARTGGVAAAETAALALYGETPPPAADISSRTNQEWWLHLLRHNPVPFQERIAWFLHDHFATSQDVFGGDEKWWMHAQIQLFRRFALRASEGGLDYDWRALLVEVCKDRAMLRWLDGVNSRRGRPNENFARELWELFMLGEGRGYTQEDIVEASRAFTGFDDVRVDGTEYDTVSYIESRHDDGAKTIFGVTGRFGYDSIAPYHETTPSLAADPRDLDGGIVALTLRERPVEASTFVCGKLAAFLLYDDPPQSVVDDLAATLRASQWNLRPVLRRILLSKAFYGRRARRSKIKDPVDFVVQLQRQTGIDHGANRVRTALDALRQRPLHPPDVNGWPTGEAWLGGQAMLDRANFVRDVIERLDDVPTQIEPLVPPPGERTPDRLVDHVAAMLDTELSPLARDELVRYVTTTLDGGGAEVPFAFDPTNPNHLEMKTRGLLYLVAQYHDAHRR